MRQGEGGIYRVRQQAMRGGRGYGVQRYAKREGEEGGYKYIRYVVIKARRIYVENIYNELRNVR
jgi:hypothetical protein